MKSILTILLVLCLVAMASAVQGAENVYEIDPVHSRVGFSVGHLGINDIAGRFTNYTGRIVLDDEDSMIEATGTVQAASVETGSDKRDTHLRGADFFHVEEYPEIKFEASAATKENGKWVLEGTFTMHGVSKKVEIPMTLKGPIKDPWDEQRIGLQGETVINRHDFGVGSDKMSDKLVGADVNIELQLEAVVQKSSE